MSISRLEHWFAGRDVILVGATGGLGAAIAAEFAERGASLRLIARRTDRLADLAGKLAERGMDVEYEALDVQDTARLSQVITRWSGASVLVNAAGMNRPGPMADLSAQDYQDMMRINVDGVFWACRSFVDARRAQGVSGCIVNISSQMGHVGGVGRVAYCATKHAVEGMTKAMAVELAAEGWRVNTVAPTFVETELTAEFLADAKQRDYVMTNIPMGRMASAQEVAAAVAFLASDLSASTTGTSLLIDGGWVAK